MKRLFVVMLWLFIVVAVTGAGAAVYLGYVWSSNLPYIGSMKDYRPAVITEIYSEEGEVIGRFWEEKRIVVPLADLPRHLIRAFVAAEDARFFEHEGVDWKGILRALFANLKAGRIEQGGSTITQQVTKSVFLKETKRTYRRKVREAILSLQLERGFSKDEILFLYLNQIYLGQGAYGVEAAAQTYFNKSAKELNIAEAALLAGLPQAPARYSPVSHPERARARQKYVLERMREEGFISEKQQREALAHELRMEPSSENPFAAAPYFTEHVRRHLVKKYGSELFYRGGLKVHTTVHLGMQRAAQEAVETGVRELDKREGYRGALEHLEEDRVRAHLEEASRQFAASPVRKGDSVRALVQEVDDQRKRVVVRIGDQLGRVPPAQMRRVRIRDPGAPSGHRVIDKPSDTFKPGDVILVKIVEAGSAPFAWEVSVEQEPGVQGALFCIAPHTGEVKAMVGGRDFSKSQFDRAVQAMRQPGSAFKPVIYAAALDKGISPAEVILDAPYIGTMETKDELWKPKNYKGKFSGPTLFRTALAESRNVVTVKILERIGISYCIEYARKLGITAPLSPDLSLALGSSGMTLREITTAYSPFANGGMLCKPIFIRRVVDRDGGILEESSPELAEVISPQTAYVMTDLLKAVINEGTGAHARLLKRPAAGKTGTTNDLRDAWFIGYTPELLAGVWVGYDDWRPMGPGETGSRAASPVWLQFMSKVLQGRPVADFGVPEGVVLAAIDGETGLLAGPHSRNTVIQAFHEGREPTEHAPEPRAAKPDQFLQFDMETSQ